MMKPILIVYFLLAMFGGSAYGQVGIFINGGTHVVCEGEASVSLKGDFINNGVYSSSTEVLVFCGTSQQEIGGSGSNSFYGLQLNNSSGVLLSSNLTVTDEFILTDGLLDLSNANLTLGARVSEIQGVPSASNMIVTSGSGALRKRYSEIPVSGASDAFTFPIGSNTSGAEYSPVIMDFEAADFGPEAYLSVQATPNKNPFFNSGITTYLERYWTLEPNDMSNYNYEVKLYYVDSDVQNGSLTEADLQPVKYSGNSWYQPAGLLNDFPDAIEQGSAFVFTESNYMVWGGLTTFSVFGGAGGSNQPLPVDLISFNGQCLGDVVGLNWSTASENNSAYFDVEKSQNGIDWSVIHSETAAGNSSAQIDYEYVDFEKTVGDVYYRLNQVDFDWNSEYYDPIQVNCGQIENVLMTFPNPSNENFTIALMNELLIGDVSAKLIDASGKVADQKELSVKPGMNNFPWSLASLQEGVYFILISGPEHVVTIKHVITK
tara:strand:- start:1224 stop:2690 length:1467 start_codon:yes stop_codon:yes gene_type:complete